MNQFGKFAEKIGILVQGGTVNVGQIRLDSEMSRQELRNRKALLNNVRTAWVEGVLEKSLHEQIPIVLGLENRPSAVASPWNLDIINPDKSCQPLPAGIPVIDIFDKLGEGRTLLILGEAGSGKTITLLQLARDLIARAEQEIDLRIPVVLNLSSWAAEKQTIAKWISEELNSKYSVPQKIGQQWLEKQELLLLFDGLDEIRDLEKRNACVTALNVFQQEQATEMVVCCRVRDYEELGDRHLKLHSAIVLQPLTTEQIQAYLDRLQSNLTVLKILLIEDKALQELAHSPLLLNIMVLTYQGIEITDIFIGTIVSNRKKQLFDDYINRMFESLRQKSYPPHLKSKVKKEYSFDETMIWLEWMAKKMIQHSQTIFLIENMQFNWLNGDEISYCQMVIYLIGVVSGGLYGKDFKQVLFYGFLGLMIFFMISEGFFSNIIPLEVVKFQWNYSLCISLVCLFGGIMITTIAPIIGGLNPSIAVNGLPFGIFWGLISGVTISLILTDLIGNEEVKEKSHPNQGIRKSAMNALVFGLFVGLVSGLLSRLVFGINFGLNVGLFLGLTTGMRCGGWTFIQHFVLRLFLHMIEPEQIPWNYAKFLDWASDKLFLQKVGGGYIFIHRSLMEHFAEMENR